MLKKFIILEIIAVVLTGFFTWRFYDRYQTAMTKKQESDERLLQAQNQQKQVSKQIDELNEEIVVLQDSIDTKILDTWKRRVQQLKQELE